MKRLLLVSFILLLAGVVFAGPPAIPPKSLIDVSDNCDQPQYYVLGRVCQSSVDGRLYKGDGNQIIEIAAGTSEGDMLGAEYAVGKKIKPSAGGTGLDTSASTGFPSISSGTWSVLSVASVKAALGFLTSTDFPVTGVETPTPGMIPKWGSSGNTLVDGFVASDFQAALTNPVTGAATTTQGMIPVWGATSNTLADGYAATYFQTALTNPVTGVASPTPGYLTKWGESGNSIADGLKLGTLTDGRWCTYTTTDGLKCTETKPAGEGGGISLSDIYTGVITDGALPKYNSATDTLSEGLKLGTLTNDKWCKYTTTGGLICNLDEPSGGGIAVSDIYLETITDGNLTSYDETSGKLKDAGPAIAYTQPDTNLPLCRTGSGAVGACTNLTDVVVPQGGGGGYTNLTSFVSQTPWRLFYSNTSGVVTELALGVDGQYLKSNGASAAPTWDTPQGGGNGIDYTPPEDPAPLCSDETGAIVACTNLKDEDLAEIEGSADDIGVKVETISEDPEAVIECEGKDRNYIVGFNEPSFFQLPADPTGVRYCFGNNDYAKVISIVPDGTDTITHGGTATTSGQGLVSTGSAQDWVCLLGLSSSKWRTISSLGTWTLDDVELPEPEPPVGDCTTPTGNIFAEGFEATGYDLTGWTATGTVNPDYPLEGLSAPEGNCDYGLFASSTVAHSYAGRDAGSAVTTHFGMFDFYISSQALDTYATASIMTAGTHATDPHADIAGSIRLYHGVGTVFRIRGAGATESTMIDLVAGSWHRITYCMTGAGSGSDPCGAGTNGHGWISTDGGTTKATFECNANNQRYYRYGVLSTDRELAVVFGYVAAGTTAFGGD